jgi:hypothetical protein
MKYIEGGLYFYSGGLLVGVLAYLTQVIKFEYGHGYLPEGGIGLMMLGLIPLMLVYYGVFLAVQSCLSRYSKLVLASDQFLSLTFIIGLVVGLAFTNENVDFAIWISYGQDTGSTIFLSVFLIEIVSILITYGITWRAVARKK